MLDNQDRPHVKPGPIKYTKGFRSRLFFSKTINILIVLMIIAIVGLAIFVFVKQPVKTEDGYVMAEPIYEFVEHGENVIVVNDDNYHLFTPLKRFLFTQDYYYGKVVAGPYGEIEKSKDKFRVTNGTEIVRVNLGQTDNEYLDLEYIARKTTKDGKVIENTEDEIITKENILGRIIAD